MKRFSFALYGLLSYTLFLVSFLYLVGFVGNLIVPKSIDAPLGVRGPAALLIDAAVLVAFFVQHSVMARPAFKQWWMRFVPHAIERSTYVLFSSLFLCLVFVAWQPLPTLLWDLRGTVAAPILLTLYAVGWLIILASSFMISHFELFGLTQAWRRARETPESKSAFVEAFFYRFVRHPILLGFFVASWAAPTMSQGRLLFAALITLYIFVGIQLEEHDLVKAFGITYRNYRARVPALFPFGKRVQGASKS